MSAIGNDNTLSGQSAPQPLPARQSSIAISRSTGASYERPERARTSHACEPCRERKTKCDGERPSCRRCLHTGTGCHYGYGKGWRKRKTAEDLTSTQRRLARYEALLNEIMPHVPSNVKAMIEEAKEQDNASPSGGSETNEDNNNNLGRSLGGLSSEKGTPTSNPRASLPYPSANPMPIANPYPVPTGQYVPPLAHPFESLSPVSASASMPPQQSPQQHNSDDANNIMRLPSITSSGQLIEPSLAAQGAALPSHQSEPMLFGRERTIGSPDQGQFSPAVSKHRSAPG